jgi:ferredoxin, 2Fe-2S
MVKVTYVEHTGVEHVVDVPVGHSLMQGATDNKLPGILGECGGQMACGTCHVFLEAPWLERCGSRSAFEQGMLEFSNHTLPNSRLGCQVKLSEALDGLVLRMPPSQP